jgi:hypothetical protein
VARSHLRVFLLADEIELDGADVAVSGEFSAARQYFLTSVRRIAA